MLRAGGKELDLDCLIGMESGRKDNDILVGNDLMERKGRTG